jgi:hypothetical protein
VPTAAGQDSYPGPLIPMLERIRRSYAIPTEAAIVAGTLLVWQAARIPLEGGVAQSLRHAHEWLAVHRALGLSGVQSSVISLVHHPVLIDAARWSYNNLHIFVIFTFMIALRAAAPARYPGVRTAFVLLHIPALIAIGVFPLASPSWLPHPPAWPGHIPSLSGSLSSSLRNQTAAVASEHFAYPVLIAAGTLWTARGRPIAWLVLLYPTWVFLFIVGTGHHYPLDAVVGTLCLAFGSTVAYVVHRSPQPVGEAPALARRSVGLALGYGLLAGWVDGLAQNRVHVVQPSLLTFAAPVAAAIAFAAAKQTRRPSSSPDNGSTREVSDRREAELRDDPGAWRERDG